jgi:cellulose synthase/poly-beta-1,6-N-acetylglucosamine synthase-like glycosyltransferase
VILICDADDIVSDGWVAAMLAGLESEDYVGGALDIRSLNDLREQDRMPLERLTTELPELWGVRYAFGGNMGLRREVVDAVGGFDESYPAGAEEIDFAWRVRGAGYEATFVPDAVIHYRLHPGLRRMLRQQFNSGLGTTQMYLTARPPGVAPKRWRQRVRHELGLLRGFPLTKGWMAWTTWLTTVAFEAGKVRGAIRSRQPVP